MGTKAPAVAVARGIVLEEVVVQMQRAGNVFQRFGVIQVRAVCGRKPAGALQDKYS
jgi:hypothetical protein